MGPEPGAPSRDHEQAFWGEDRPRVRRPRRPPVDGPLDRLRELLSAWRGDGRIGLVVLAAGAVVAGVVWYQVGVGGADSPPPRERAATATTVAGDVAGGATPITTSAGGGGPVVVHVAGSVTHPGVVELEAGARVIDAIEAAGGALATADLDRLNLAAKLADGERVLVQDVGDPVAPAPPTGGTPASSGGDAASGGLVNLNTATPEQLEELPGIGPVLAEAILTERDRRGGFESVLELRDVRGIGEKRFADLADLVTV